MRAHGTVIWLWVAAGTGVLPVMMHGRERVDRQWSWFQLMDEGCKNLQSY